MAKIGLTDSTVDVLFKMSEGNPGALQVIMGILEQGDKIDPENAFGGLGTVMLLDTYEIYGPRIYMLCSDCCRKDLVAVFTMVRAVQMGMHSVEELNASIGTDLGGRGTDIYEKAQELCKELQTKLPKFNGGKPLGEESSDDATTGKESNTADDEEVGQESGDEQMAAGCSDKEASG